MEGYGWEREVGGKNASTAKLVARRQQKRKKQNPRSKTKCRNSSERTETLMPRGFKIHVRISKDGTIEANTDE
ncbi:hypothetical protein PEX1_007910 [Penicillium expansum]|uniref:Uncharacterized protein n=1 Tax=Penicillium expansum TaxID=27334 RepID=A0A0A2IKA0_PENEN|nr:hypothetical protein PEX2_003380 [Penicillium expansum]KGO42863.1 hypothetical protein PEXP_026120 [Penicillium expansum]KGO56984.1 hypothetical protein PEX2_003380 [Penicillium expansum]KGO61605.1 hypothetical protein PEX1_007910 [Penicillium expansum]